MKYPIRQISIWVYTLKVGCYSLLQDTMMTQKLQLKAKKTKKENSYRVTKLVQMRWDRKASMEIWNNNQWRWLPTLRWPIWQALYRGIEWFPNTISTCKIRRLSIAIKDFLHLNRRSCDWICQANGSDIDARFKYNHYIKIRNKHLPTLCSACLII